MSPGPGSRAGLGVGVGQRSSSSAVISGNNYPVGLPSARLGLEKIE